VIETTEPEPELLVETPVRKNYTPSKRELGVATPKRGGANGRRVGGPPMDKKEAMAQRRKDAAERRAAMADGKEWALLPRDRGPEKQVARDVVDSRHNILEYVLYVLVLFMLATFFTSKNPHAATMLELIMLVVVVPVVIIDSVLLSRRVKRVVTETLPNAPIKGISRYAIMRAMSFRRGRVPKPQVNRGDAIRQVK
jgi:Protein of unknown function (DUF3043)